MCLELVVVGILHGMGQQTYSSTYSVLDCTLRVGIAWLLIPRYGVWGFVIMVIVSNLFTSLLNLRRLLKITDISMRVNDWIVKPALAALAASQGVRSLFYYTTLGQLPLWGGLIVGFAVIGVIYTGALLCLGCVTKGDIVWALERFRPSPSQMNAVSQKGLQGS
jgi:stage V sporulation protein B